MPKPSVDSGVRDLLRGDAAVHEFAEQIEGPYHRPVHPDRRTIVEDRSGHPLTVGIRVLDGRRREPVPGMELEIWHADKDGRYSGFLPIQAQPGDVVTSRTVPTEIVAPSESFLRGRQRTDDLGMCQFDTIFPGWYPSRTVHIHLIAHVSEGFHLTTQLYFPDDVVDAVFARPPYDARPRRDTTNATDSIFLDGGSDSTVTVRESAAAMIAALSLVLPA